MPPQARTKAHKMPATDKQATKGGRVWMQNIRAVKKEACGTPDRESICQQCKKDESRVAPMHVMLATDKLSKSSRRAWMQNIIGVSRNDSRLRIVAKVEDLEVT